MAHPRARTTTCRGGGKPVCGGVLGRIQGPLARSVMSLPVILRPEAIEDLQNARKWYERQRAGLGSKFATRAASVLDGIGRFPELYGLVWQDVRAAPIRRHPAWRPEP